MKRLLALCCVGMALVSLVATVAHAAPKPSVTPATTPAVVDSLGLLERAVARDSSKFDNLYALGVMYMDRMTMDKALVVMAKAVSVQPRNVKALVNAGIAADATGKPEMAQDFYLRALAVAPNDAIAGCRLAESKYGQGKYDESVTMLRELIAKNPRATCAYFTLGEAFADAGIFRDAIRMWKKLVELAPDSPEAISAKESIDVLERFLAGGK